LYIRKEAIKIYLYNIDCLIAEIDLLKKEIEIFENEEYILHPLKSSQLSYMPKSGINGASPVESFAFKQNQYLQSLIDKELHLRALHISIKIVLNRLKPFEKDVYDCRKNNLTYESISDELKKSDRYIKIVSKRIIDNIYDNYKEYSKALT